MVCPLPTMLTGCEDENEAPRLDVVGELNNVLATGSSVYSSYRIIEFAAVAYFDSGWRCCECRYRHY